MPGQGGSAMVRSDEVRKNGDSHNTQGRYDGIHGNTGGGEQHVFWSKNERQGPNPDN